jgi:Uncharacterized protein conserved in bacteria (DUF2252)
LNEVATTEERSSAPRTVAHFTPAERVARGKAARGELPRSAHADRAPDRRDPVDLLEEQAQTRLPELGPIRYGRMLVSPFTFFRGAAYLMAADLADEPRTGVLMLSTLIAPDIVEYLDTGKIGARSVAGERIIFARPGPELEYWEDED